MLTEAQWLSVTYIHPLLGHLVEERKFHRTNLGRRKLRLFGCASCRLIWDLLPKDPCQNAVEIAERYADGLATKQDLQEACSNARNFLREDFDQTELYAIHATVSVTDSAAKKSISAGLVVSFASHLGWTQDSKLFCDLLREIFGNPFRPLSIKSSWLTSHVKDLAKTIYEERDFDRMPILADALIDAGCNEEEILTHCHSTQKHVRGCWVVDLLLGKQ
jgi:hypothetical protein